MEKAKNLRVDQVAERLNCSPRSVYRLIVDGALPAFRIRSSLRVPVDAVEAYIGRQILEFQKELYGLESDDISEKD